MAGFLVSIFLLSLYGTVKFYIYWTVLVAILTYCIARLMNKSNKNALISAAISFLVIWIMPILNFVFAFS